MDSILPIFAVIMIPMESFKFTPQIIKSIETELRKPFSTLAYEVSMTNILVVIKKTHFLKSEDEAIAMLQEYLDSDESNSLESLQLLILEGLQNSGFLSRKTDLGAARAAI